MVYNNNITKRVIVVGNVETKVDQNLSFAVLELQDIFTLKTFVLKI